MQHKHLSIFFFFILSLFSFTTHAETEKPSAQAVFQQLGDPVAGNPKGSVTMVEFLDYQCSHCAEMTPIIDAIIKDNPDLRVVYKVLPLRGPISEEATKAALAANLQGKFLGFSHALLRSSQNLNSETILTLAKSSGLDMTRLKADMKSDSITNNITANTNLAAKLGIPGTPAFYFGKTNTTNLDAAVSVIGSVDQRELQNAINAASQ